MTVREVSVAGGTGIGEAIATRIKRGIDLYGERAGEITHLGADKYRVPSSRGYGSYVVDVEEETCQCADRRGHALGICKHLSAALIAAAKRPEYRVIEGRYHDCLRGREYHLYTYRLGGRAEYIGSYGSRAEAYAEKWAIEHRERS